MIFNILGRATQAKGFLAAATVAAVACSLTSLAGAQAPAARATAAQRLAVPRTPDGKPDVSGVWAGAGFKHTQGAKYPDQPDPSLYVFTPPKDAFKPGAEARWTLKLNNDARHDDPTLFCLPLGFPYIDLAGRAQHFFQPPGYLVITYEDDHYTRIVPVGKSHPKDLDPTWYGNSVAHWEGDTLVVDVTGLKEWESDARHHQHSEKAHYLEKYTRTGPTTMTIEIVTDDPEIFVRPWSQKWEMHLRQDWEVFEDICEENNLDPGLISYMKTEKK